MAYKYSKTTKETQEQQHIIAKYISDGSNLNRLYQYLADNEGKEDKEKFLQEIDIPNSEEIKLNNLIIPHLIDSFNSTVDKYSNCIQHGGITLDLNAMQKKSIDIPTIISTEQNDKIIELAKNIIGKDEKDYLNHE